MKTKDVAAAARIQLRRHGQRQRLTAALDDDGDGCVLGSIQRGSKVLESADRMTIYRLDHVAVAQAGRACRGAGIDRADLDRRFDLGRTDRGVDAEENQDGKGEVEGGPGNDHNEPLPEWMGVEAAWPGVHAAVHAGQLDEATQWDRPDGVQRLAALPAHQLGAEPDAELLDLDAGQFGRQEVTGFVHDDQPAEDQDDEGHEDDWTHAGSSLRTLLVPLEAVRT